MRKIILGTDWWTDCDDAAALRIACRAHKKGLWQLLGVSVNACMGYTIPSVDAFMVSEDLWRIPLGLDHKATGFGGKPSYQKSLAIHFSNSRTNDGTPEALDLCRQILEQEEGPIEFVEIGYPQVLAGLISSEEGMELVRRKVSHLWMMAGNWENDGRGRENNFARSDVSRRAAAYLLKNYPGDITFLGWEVGSDVISGGHETGLDSRDALRTIFEAHGSVNGRSSWDPMTILLALEGCPERAGYTTVRGWASVDPETGENSFIRDENGRHRYVIKTRPDAQYADEINRWLAS